MDKRSVTARLPGLGLSNEEYMAQLRATSDSLSSSEGQNVSPKVYTTQLIQAFDSLKPREVQAERIKIKVINAQTTVFAKMHFFRNKLMSNQRLAKLRGKPTPQSIRYK